MTVAKCRVCPPDSQKKKQSVHHALPCMAGEIEPISSPQWAQAAWRRRLADILPLSCDLCSDRGQRLAAIRPCVLITHSLYSFLPLIRASPLCVCECVCVYACIPLWAVERRQRSKNRVWLSALFIVISAPVAQQSVIIDAKN